MGVKFRVRVIIKIQVNPLTSIIKIEPFGGN